MLNKFKNVILVTAVSVSLLAPANPAYALVPTIDFASIAQAARKISQYTKGVAETVSLVMNTYNTIKSLGEYISEFKLTGNIEDIANQTVRLTNKISYSTNRIMYNDEKLREKATKAIEGYNEAIANNQTDNATENIRDFVTLPENTTAENTAAHHDMLSQMQADVAIEMIAVADICRTSTDPDQLKQLTEDAVSTTQDMMGKLQAGVEISASAMIADQSCSQRLAAYMAKLEAMNVIVGHNAAMTQAAK